MPRSVAEEMVLALKLQNHFVDRIQNAILGAIKMPKSIKSYRNGFEEHKEEEIPTNISQSIDIDHLKLDTMKIQISDHDMNQSQVMKLDRPSPHNLNRSFSKESIKIRSRQDTHTW